MRLVVRIVDHAVSRVAVGVRADAGRRAAARVRIGRVLVIRDYFYDSFGAVQCLKAGDCTLGAIVDDRDFGRDDTQARTFIGQ